MKPLSPDEMNELRNDIASLNIPADRQDELIRLIDAIVISFIDQEYGLDPVQLSLAARANYAFKGEGSCDSLALSEKDKAVDLGEEGAINTVSPARHRAP
jgi:hypothetical protein